MEVENYVRTAITIGQLIQLSQHIIEKYDLYVEKGTEEFDENSIAYLDEPIDVNDETSEEIYPDFAINLDLQWHFSGQVVWDIIKNTRCQLINPTLSEYIKNFNHYDEHDCYYDFSKK